MAWGQMATGEGHSRLNETMGVIGVATKNASFEQRGRLGTGGSKN